MDFLKRFAKRLGFTLLTILAMSILIFFLVEIMPGDVAQTVLGQSATEESVAALRDRMGLMTPCTRGTSDGPAVLSGAIWVSLSTCAECRLTPSSGEKSAIRLSWLSPRCCSTFPCRSSSGYLQG
ncbi:MAG: hypothetical protein ACOC2R_09715 [Spirochaetota bacterium]